MVRDRVTFHERAALSPKYGEGQLHGQTSLRERQLVITDRCVLSGMESGH